MNFKYLGVLIIGLGSVTHAQVKDEVRKEATASNPSDAEIDKLMNAYTEAKDKLQKAKKEGYKNKAYKAATALYEEGMKDLNTLYKKVFEVAKLAPPSATSLKGLVWSYRWVTPEDQAVVLDLLMKHHKESDSMAKVITIMSRTKTPDMKILNDFMVNSKIEKVRQNAMEGISYIFYNDPNKLKEAEALCKQLVESPTIAELNPSILSVAESCMRKIKHFSIGSKVLDIKGKDQAGKRFKLSDSLGKVTLLYFWSSPATEGLAHKRSLLESLKDKPFNVVGVCKSSVLKLKKHVADGDVTWRNFSNTQNFSHLSRAWLVQEWPTSYLIDHKGILRHIGISDDKMEAAIKKLVAEAEASKGN